jgi:preprotein translocase subunit SecY
VKKLAQTFKNIWNIEELRSKIIVTLALVLTYRFGTHIVLPGINPLALDAIKANNKTDGLLGLFDAFAGGAISLPLSLCN